MQISLNLFDTFGNLMPIAYGNFISLHIPFIFGISVIILCCGDWLEDRLDRRFLIDLD